MTINPPKNVRLALYLITILGTPLVAYLNAKGIIGSLEVAFWSAEVAVVSGLAALNTSSRTEATVAVTAPADVDVTLEPAVEYDGHGAPISDERGASDVVTVAAVLVIVIAAVVLARWLV